MDLRKFEIFYTPNYENAQRKIYYSRLRWYDIWALILSVFSTAFCITSSQISLESRLQKSDPYEGFDNLKFFLRISAMALNVFIAILLYYRYQMYLCLQKWKNEEDHTTTLRQYRLFWKMVIEILIFLLVIPPKVDWSFGFVYIIAYEEYQIDSFISVIALFRSTYLLIRAAFENSKFNDSKAYQICVSVQCTTDQNTFTIKAENKDKHFYMLIPSLFVLILVLSYGLRECEVVLTGDLKWQNYAYSIWSEAATLTTVGYGDAVPHTLFGRIFIILCCLLGPAIISFSIISLVNFSQFTNSESLVYEAITLASKNTELRNLAAKSIFYSRKYFRAQDPDREVFNNFKSSLIRFKTLKKDIANQKKYPPVENFVIKFCTTAVNVVQNIQHQTSNFSFYLTLLSKMEVLQQQIDQKVYKLKKVIKEKSDELLKTSLSKDILGPQLNTYPNQLKGLNRDEMMKELHQEMTQEQFALFQKSLQEVGRTKQIVKTGKKVGQSKKIVQEQTTAKDKGMNKNNFDYDDLSEQASKHSSIDQDSIALLSEDSSLKQNEKQGSSFNIEPLQQESSPTRISRDSHIFTKSVTFLMKGPEPDIQESRSSLIQMQPVIKSSMKSLKEEDQEKQSLNDILAEVTDPYENISNYILRYCAIKEFKSLSEKDMKNGSSLLTQDNFLTEQFECVSNLATFKQNFIFRFVEVSEISIQQSILSQIKQSNLLLTGQVQKDRFAFYFQNGRFAVYENATIKTTTKIPIYEQLYLLDDTVYAQSTYYKHQIYIYYMNKNLEIGEPIKLQFQQREEVELKTVVQQSSNIGLLDNEGNYFTTSSSITKKMQERPGNKLPIINPTIYILSFKVKNVSCGYEFVIFLTQFGKLYSTGLNDQGQLGLSDNLPRTGCLLISQLAQQHIVQVASGIAHSLALTNNGDFFSWGNGSKGQLLPGKKFQGGGKVLPVLLETKKKNLQIQCGRYSSSVLNDEFLIEQWGDCISKLTHRIQMYDLITIYHQTSWSLKHEVTVLTCFRLPRDQQIVIDLQKRLRKAILKVASDQPVAGKILYYNILQYPTPCLRKLRKGVENMRTIKIIFNDDQQINF